MVSLCLLLGCNLSYVVDLSTALHELASASARTLLKLASSVRALLKPYGDTLRSLGPANSRRSRLLTEDNKVTRDETSDWLSLHVSASWGERK